MNFRIAALAALALATITTTAEAKRTHYRAAPQAGYAYPQYSYPATNNGFYVPYGGDQQNMQVSRKQVRAGRQSVKSAKSVKMDKDIRRATSSRAYKRLTRKLAESHENSVGATKYEKVHTSTGLTATVIASAKDKFQGFIDAVEAAGYKIGDLGCKSWGHMRNSKHHWGGACDFDQKRRSVTAKFMYHVTEIAQRFGLTDGCTWHPRDCGHIEVPGPNSPHRNQYAMR